MKTLTAKLTGTAPLLMHNERLANPMDPIARKMKEITNKRKKTDTDLELLQNLEWIGGMYCTEDVGVNDGVPVGGGRPAIKASMVEAMLIKAAKRNKLGETFKAAVFIDDDLKIPLEYEGSKDLAKIIKTPQFRDVRGCKLNQSKVMRTRPRFNSWAVTVTATYLEDSVNERDLREAFEYGGMMVGIGDYRPKFGRFSVEFVG